ncbi:kinase-like domain-containing protein [Colletotrichum cereale]|nr:kinase-like domain-containing protein [Colletotrichum cereale]
MFTNLENMEGMIQYIGCFKVYEPDASGGLELYWNIVLELADFDFYTAIRTESPPISAKEILGFWKTMAEISGALASIHTVVIDSHQYLTWHGDIKPENILRVNDRFKLADPGEARMQLKSIGTSGDQKTRATGGTRTYAAPEKADYLDGRSRTKPEVSQTSDVWSLGCVLSIAATYVVLGTQGVLIFDQLRREAIFGITGNLSDAFHDGKVVLPEVRHWHDYLREAARRNDVYTSAVLDMVDNHMFVAKDRWSAKRICQEFDKLFESTKCEASRVPRSLHNLLQRIDLQSEQQFDYLQSGIRRVDPDDIATEIPQVLNLPPADVEFKSRGMLLEQAIQPVAQRSQGRLALPIHSRNPSTTSHLTTPILVWRSLGYDDNGMELYFTDPDTDPKAKIVESRSQKPKLFSNAMKYAEPAVAKSPTQVVDTTIVPELTRIINGYTRAKTSKSPPRKKTIIILTDGIWKGMRMEHTIDVYLRSIFNELKDLHGDLSYIPPGKSREQVDISKIRPVTIQFVQFGDDTNATERLRRLDDDMTFYGCP